MQVRIGDSIFCCLTEQNKGDPNLLLDKLSRLTATF